MVDKRAAELYLDKIFGTERGYVAVAYKDKGNSWQESQFAWPADRRKLLGWAEIHKDANLFICPALRTDAHTRKKGDGKALRWLWADVDWQIVPAERRADVAARIKELGSLVIRSGTGENSHVYVALDREVSREEFAKLNTGLKDYLYADAKQADNSFLRLPGTTNWKTSQGSAVEVWDKRDGVVAPGTLLKRRAFRDARVIQDAESSEWEYIEMDGLPRRIRALATMPVAEAESRYGSRYKAVWGVTGELHKRGLGTDEIHSLMDKFPAAQDKMADENGYDVHRDVDKRLFYDRAKTVTVDDAEIDGDAGDVFEEVSFEDAQTSMMDEQVQKELLRRSVRRTADFVEAERAWSAPPADTSSSLSDLLAAPPAPTQYLIDDMCSAEGYVLIVGQYKTGKTKLMVNSLLTALADDEPFLGEKAVHVPEGGAICGHWNLEMTPVDLIDKYMRTAEFKNPHNVHVANWQGYGVNLLTEPGKKMAIEWLTTRRVAVWTIDSWSALCRGAGVDPNDGGQVGMLAQAIIDIRVQAGVKAVFMLAHISRSSQDSDRPATLGSVALDGIVDTRWMMTTDAQDVRSIQAEGRGTTMARTTLDFDEDTGRSVLGTAAGSKGNHGWVQEAMSVVASFRDQGVNQTTLFTKLKERGHAKTRQRLVDTAAQAVDDGYLRTERVPRGGKASIVYFLVEAPSGDDRARRATPGEVDMSTVRVRKRHMS